MKARTYWFVMWLIATGSCVYWNILLVLNVLADKPYADTRNTSLIWLTLSALAGGKLLEGGKDDR